MLPALSQVRTWFLASPVLASLLLASGCSADLDNPEAFSDRAPPSAGASNASAGATSSSAGVSTAGTSGGGSAGVSGGGSNAGGAGAAGGTGVGADAGASGNGGSGGSSGNAASAGATGLPGCVAALFVNGTGKCAASVCHAKGSSPAGGLDLGSPGVEQRLLDQIARHEGLDASATCSTSDKLIDSSDPSKSWLLKKLTGQQGNCGARMPLGQTLTPDELSCMQSWIQSY